MFSGSRNGTRDFWTADSSLELPRIFGFTRRTLHLWKSCVWTVPQIQQHCTTGNCEIPKIFNVPQTNFAFSTQPDWIDTMTNLTNIYLQANCLTELPEAIQFLTSLEIFDVSQNHLTKIPSSIGKLVKLKRIVLTHNQITSLPSSVGNLLSLTSLLLSSNRLSELPHSLRQCVNLEDLHLDFNNFKGFPKFITRLPRLQALSICSNQLTDLPHLPFVDIKRFHFDNNPRICYLPYTLACQINRPPASPLATRNVLHISCHGCFQPSSRGEANILVGEDWPLCFPQGIGLCANTPPSLLELTLRSISSRMFSNPLDISFDRRNNLHRFESIYHRVYDQRIDEFCLPSTLIQLLRDGPNAFCHQCRTFMFHGPVHPLFLSKIMVQDERQQLIQPVVCSLLFCSASCIRAAVSSKTGLDDRLDWVRIAHRTSAN